LALVKQQNAEAVKELALANNVNPLQQDLVLSYFQALEVNNQPADAEKLAMALIDKQKTYAPIYDLLYFQYLKHNRADDAEKLLKLKTQNNPKNANYMLQLAGHYFVNKRRPEMDAVIQKMTDEKNFPEGHLLAGDFFFLRLGEFESAQQQYEAAIKAFPKDKTIYEKRMVELFASRGKNNEANQLLATILHDNPKDADAIAMRAALMLTTGNRDQINMAVNDLQALVTKTPDNHLLRFNLARALWAKSEYEQCRLQLEEAIKLRPDFMAAREWLARVYLVKQDYGKALKAADDILALDMNNLPGHLARSSALLGLNDQEKAGQELTLITKNYPQNIEARYQVGFLAWQEKDYKKAEQVFGDLYKNNPKDPRGLFGVVETLTAEQRMDEALREMEKSVKADPERRDFQLALANLDVRAQKYDAAIQIYQGLVEKEPKSADLLFKLGETYRRKGDLNVAIETFRKASQAAPNDTNSLLQLGLLMDGTGRREQAQPIYEQILKIQPDHPVALNNLAFIKAQLGSDLDQAMTMAQRARQKAPNSPDIADTLGWIYIKKNLSDEAIRIFRELVGKDPTNPIYHYHFGMALMQKGDRPSAKREFETAMKHNPSKDDAKEIQTLLQKL
jgi:tetratricopeptide (TPR) repeat protein